MPAAVVVAHILVEPLDLAEQAAAEPLVRVVEIILELLELLTQAAAVAAAAISQQETQAAALVVQVSLF